MSDKQPEALISELEAASILLRRSCSELRRLHALCEEQKRLLEQARDELNAVKRVMLQEVGIALVDEKALSAITNHLRQHEGEKHD